MLKSTLLLAVALQLNADPEAPPTGASERSERTPPTALYDGSARQLDVLAPVIADPEIRIDGRLDDAAWASAAILTGFTQYDPVEGSPASEHTEVRMLVSGDAIYFAIRADDKSGGVRATLTDRDGYGRSDDYVRILLDTFNDRRRAYVFMVNPYGVQADGLWSEGGGGRGGFGDPIDWSSDFLWQSDGRLNEDGYTVEVRIPLKSMRFPEKEVQDWGLQVQRQIRRTGYAQSWAPITEDKANRLAQSGSIRQLRGLDAGLFLEINPTLTGSRSGSFDNERNGLRHAPIDGDFGLNVTYGLTSNLTLDGTVNPDFSQVEADAGQIVVNERFAIRLPERRPFFLEGADIFDMPRQLVYTRSIGNPVGAAKISGKVGSFNVAYLGAVDDVGPDAANPVVNLLRVRHDVGRSSSLGAVYTDRTTSSDHFNRVFGSDARLVIAGRYTVGMLAAGSADALEGERARYGSLLRGSVSRSSRALTLNASFEDISDDFVAGSGFIRRVGVTQARGRTGYTFRGDRRALVQSWGPSLELERTWTGGDFWAGRGPLESSAQVGLSGSFRGNVGGFLNYSRESFDFTPTFYEGFFSGSSPDALTPLAVDPALFGGLQRVSLRGWISSWERVRVSLGAGWNETPIFSRGVPVDRGTSWSADVGFTIYPTGSSQLEVGGRHVSIFRSRDGSRYSSATIPRVQARYQLSRALFVRGIGEYSSQERGDLLDPSTGQPVYHCSDDACFASEGSDRHDFSIEGLLAYEASPGTVFFLGYTRQFRDTAAFRFDEVRALQDGLFVKLSYRFRM